MKILIMYYSRTGNTKRLAEAISEGISEIENVKYALKKASDVTSDDFLSSQGIIAGSPVYFGTMAAELKAIFDKFVNLRKKIEGKVGAAFASGADSTGGKETTLISIIQAMLIYGMVIVGDPLDATGHYGVSCTGFPTEKEINNAKKLGKRVAMLINKLNPD